MLYPLIPFDTTHLVLDDHHPLPKILVPQLDALQHLPRLQVHLPDRRPSAEEPRALVQEAAVEAQALAARCTMHDAWRMMDGAMHATP